MEVGRGGPDRPTGCPAGSLASNIPPDTAGHACLVTGYRKSFNIIITIYFCLQIYFYWMMPIKAKKTLGVVSVPLHTLTAN
jgi:hypothetical protein